MTKIFKALQATQGDPSHGAVTLSSQFSTVNGQLKTHIGQFKAFIKYWSGKLGSWKPNLTIKREHLTKTYIRWLKLTLKVGMVQWKTFNGEWKTKIWTKDMKI